MELLLKRNQSSGLFGRTYTLWAKLEVSEKEQTLIKKHKLTREVMYEDARDALNDEKADLGRAKKFAWLALPPTIISYFVFIQMLPILPTFGLCAVVFVASVFFIGRFVFDATRKSILLRDLFKGRITTSRSFPEIEQLEAALHEKVDQLNRTLAAMEDWSGQDVSHAA